MAWLTGEAQTGEGILEDMDCVFKGRAVFRKEEDVIRVAEIMEPGDGVEPAIEGSEVEVCEKASDGSAKGYSLIGRAELLAVEVGETDASFEQVEQVVVLGDEAADLVQEKFVGDGGEVGGNVAFGDEERRIAGREEASDFALAAIETEAAKPVSVGIARDKFMEARGKQAVEQEINEAFFPRIDVESALFAFKISMENDTWTIREVFGPKRAMDGVEILRAATSEVV